MDATKHLSVLLFEDHEQSMSMTTRNVTNTGKSLGDLLAELSEINRKILKIEIQEQSIQEKVHTLSTRVKTTGEKRDGRNLEEVFMFLEQKLQALISESERAIEEVKEEVERVLTREMLSRKMKKYQNTDELAKMEKLYQQKLKLSQDSFTNELSTITKHNLSIQQAFQTRLISLQHKFTTKLKQMQANQQHLKSIIEQQDTEIRLLGQTTKSCINTKRNDLTTQTLIPHKNVQLGSKQTRHQLIEAKGVLKENEESEKDGHSRIRRNKIFDKRSTRVDRQSEISPIKTAEYSELNSLKIFNNALDKFEDFKEHNLDGSDQDVFFYPQPRKDLGALLMASPQTSVVNNFKFPEPVLFSPFDLN